MHQEPRPIVSKLHRALVPRRDSPVSPHRSTQKSDNMNRGHLLLAFTLLLAACSRDQGISRTLARHVDSNSATVDLAAVGPSSWERVCFFGPYSSNQRVEKILGFRWDADGKSSIGRNDGINLLVFVRHQEVVAYTEHPRNKGDVVKLSSRCLSRSHAELTRQVESGGWVQLVRN